MRMTRKWQSSWLSLHSCAVGGLSAFLHSFQTRVPKSWLPIERGKATAAWTEDVGLEHLCSWSVQLCKGLLRQNAGMRARQLFDWGWGSKEKEHNLCVAQSFHSQTSGKKIPWLILLCILSLELLAKIRGWRKPNSGYTDRIRPYATTGRSSSCATFGHIWILQIMPLCFLGHSRKSKICFCR